MKENKPIIFRTSSFITPESYWMNLLKIYILGPAQAKTGLEKEVPKLFPHAKKLMEVETVNSLSENQVLAKILDFFKTRKVSP